MTVRLSDVATHAGVSEATVSRVLNARPGVAVQTRQAVLAALDLLGYERPSRLRTTGAGLVGLVVPELENPVFPAFVQVIETILAQRQYTPLLCTQTPGGVSEDEYVDMLLDRGVAGIVFVSGLHADSTASPDRYVRLRELGVPVVLVNGYVAGLDAPFVSTDDVAAAGLAVGHLASLGHTRIGLVIGPRRFVPAARKIEGFTRALRAVPGAPAVENAVATSFFTVEGGRAGAEQLLDAGCTGIVCGSDLMALGAVRAVRNRGLDVPGDVSVVGYDDSPLMPFTDPPLTTVRQAVPAMSAAAVNALMEQIAGVAPERSELLFAPDLVVRASTGPAPGLRAP
ncbi:LacI family DNA-binding transcriptional regulator [Jiangella asiatica]|uniref:LacI family transcriptional regulator n=1 Tax=Jiangella asiatica TaxID=2530372 RepID=A0A4R5DIT4_9ACTN|nr:LacI family DNA-binding transcriptional regulator [Jiangella asiatica]TDE10413.1 LacI family transcriptional regulator [Jiangella asiatica]